MGLELSFHRLVPGDSRLEELAALHETYPGEWLEDHIPSAESIARVAAIFRREVEKPTFFCEYVLDATDVLVGMHWLDIHSVQDLPVARISSLWVHEDLRNQGVARQLKERGEAWAKSQCALSMITEVHVNNTAMLEVNEKLGFAIRGYAMRKKL